MGRGVTEMSRTNLQKTVAGVLGLPLKILPSKRKNKSLQFAGNTLIILPDDIEKAVNMSVFIHFWNSHPAQKPVVSGPDGIGAFFGADEKKMPGRFLSGIRFMRSHRFKTVIDLSLDGSTFNATLMRAAGVENRAGFSIGSSNRLLTHDIFFNNFTGHPVHQVRSLYEQSLLQKTDTDINLEKYLSEGQLSEKRKPGGRRILIHLSRKHHETALSQGAADGLLAALTENGYRVSIYCEHEHDYRPSETGYDIITAPGFKETAEHIKNVTAVISQNSWLGALSGLLRVPVVVITAAANPRLYTPFSNRAAAVNADIDCHPCTGLVEKTVKCSRKDELFACADRVSTEKVIAELEKLLKEKKPAGVKKTEL